MSSSDHRPQTLEVEDAEQRQKRLRMCSVFPPFFSRPTQCGFFLVWSTEAILERLNGEGSSTGESPNLSFDFGDRRTFAMEPPTERACHPTFDDLGSCLTHHGKTVLARVQQFLPQIERSNVELSQMDPRSIDIEHIEETDERIIEMASCA